MSSEASHKHTGSSQNNNNINNNNANNDIPANDGNHDADYENSRNLLAGNVSRIASHTNNNNDEGVSSNNMQNAIGRRLTRTSIPTSIPSASDVDSENSDTSTDTEEDVWFPMDPENNRDHHGIDFDELQQFIDFQREENRSLLRENGKIDDDNEDYNNFHDGLSGGNNVAFNKERRHRLKNSKKKLSKAAMKYIPKWLHHQNVEDNGIGLVNLGGASNIHIGNNNDVAGSFSDVSSKQDAQKTAQVVDFDDNMNKIEGDDSDDEADKLVEAIPNRFSLFTSDSEGTIHAHDLPSLVQPGQTIKDLFNTEDQNFVWWLDCCCASDNEIKILAKSFGIHPLTTEDIRMSENREKVEFFKDYYFITFHSFDSDNESEEFLEPINFYMVVFRSGILTFHSTPVVHCINVRRRIRQLKEYIPLSSDWICYALIDNITDSFFPVINAIDYETDAIEASVFVIRDVDFSTMLHRIGESRRKVMTLMRLLSGKADVLRMLYKRCHEHVIDILPSASNVGEGTITENKTFSNLVALNNAILAAGPSDSQSNVNDIQRNSLTNASLHQPKQTGDATPISGRSDMGETIQPRSEIALFLGDIQDHIITLNMNLSSYEKILSRSYTNYLAQLQVESFNSNNKVTDILSKVTVLGTLLVPLNLVGSLFGMNVKVPGQGVDNLGWWFGILGVMLLSVVVGLIVANWWLRRVNTPIDVDDGDDSRTFISRLIRRGNMLTGSGPRNNDSNTRSIVSFPNN
ncbi:Mg(2+) transporter [Saccharomycopsis crataegensis]|uniref:Mg(2+) transporter n=1 Tax=Saccharomycopsis crataegensis TaxID=43959 RepID=A0AAV5QM97_9ASCO|nr:Mg(2+) transporter [Saccharomycopsis crataegensis]